jgi:hypothetical protein
VTSDEDNSVLWLHGLAGTGKSAIVAECTEGRELVAFFSRGFPSRNTTERFWVTMFQIAMSMPELRDSIGVTVMDNLSPSIFFNSAKKQLQKLIVEPLCSYTTGISDLSEKSLSF